jgi:hypothetical protein
VSEDGSTAKDIDIRIQKARGAFSGLRRIWQSTFIHKDMKIKIFNACVKSVLYCMDAKRGWLQAVSKENFNPLSTDVCTTFIIKKLLHSTKGIKIIKKS